MSADVEPIARAYLLAWLAALAVGFAVPVEHPIGVALCADLAATAVVFAAGVRHANSSFYDAFWSVAPLPIALYWALGAGDGASGSALRAALVLTLVAAWGARLTWNWFRGWGGLAHEDWRYVDLRARSGRWYPLVNFAGIHVAPTLWVFLGCLPLYPPLAAPRHAFGVLDAAALALGAGAVWLEARADAELLRFRRAPHAPGEFLRSGVWAWCRHPNYLGEMGFWWSLWLVGLAANPAWWWTGVGALSITLLFRFASLPMMERRMLERRPAYAEWVRRSSLVLPRLQRSSFAPTGHDTPVPPSPQ
jgi:steroid 5-alpha reductase family enzyme